MSVAEKKIELAKLPDTLIIQLKRFEKDKWGLTKKNDKKVGFSNNLWINNVEYELYSFINHTGNKSGGHYTAFCKEESNDSWSLYIV